VTTEKARGNPIAFQSFVSASDFPFVIGDGGFVIQTRRGLWGVAVAGASNDVDEELGRVVTGQLAAILQEELS
jgi:hypothetical protein